MKDVHSETSSLRILSLLREKGPISGWQLERLQDQVKQNKVSLSLEVQDDGSRLFIVRPVESKQIIQSVM